MNFASLQHSVFLNALGSAILNSLWQSFILWFLYEAIILSYKSASARFKNNLSSILLFFSFIWFLISFSFKIAHTQADISNITPIAITGPSQIHATSLLQEFITYAGSSLPYLSVAYIFLLFFLMAKLFTAYRYVYIISNKRLITPPSKLKNFAIEVALQLKIARKVTVWISHHVDVPATIGFIKPIILIPFASLNNLSGDQLEAIILHELSHIKRNDYLTNILLSVIETILFFNPFVVLLSKVIKRERENCCDDFVLQYQYDPHSYASALLRLEQSRVQMLKLAIGAVSGKKQLLSRIKRITNGQVAAKQFNYGQKLLALLLVTGIICSIAWLSPGEKKQLPTKVVAKEVDSIHLQKNSLPSKSLTIIKGQTESFASKILQRILIKKNVPSNKTGVQEPGDESDETSNNITDLLSTSPDNFTPPPAPSKQPAFYFDEQHKLNLPPSINLKNFPFRDLTLNINMSKIELEKLNSNLKEAYKEINKIDWDNVQKDIRKSFLEEKTTNFPSKKELESYIEKARDLFLMNQDAKQFNNKILKGDIRKQLKLQDSLNSQVMLCYEENKAKIEDQYKKLQNLYADIPQVKTYLKYSINSLKNINTEENQVWIANNKNKLNPSGKKITITVKRSPKKDFSKEQRKFVQFLFDNNEDTKKSTNENFINVELTDLP